MKKGRVQAKDIPDREVLLFVAAERRSKAASSWEVEDQFYEYPTKVVRAKLAALVRRGLVSGCACGCRGDFHLLTAGKTALLRKAFKSFTCAECGGSVVLRPIRLGPESYGLDVPTCDGCGDTFLSPEDRERITK